MLDGKLAESIGQTTPKSVVGTQTNGLDATPGECKKSAQDDEVSLQHNHH